MKRMLLSASLAVALTIGAVTVASAAPLWVEEFQNDLYSGETTRAEMVADSRIRLEPGDMQARFALGTVRFLGAIERLGQGLYRFGSKKQYNPGFGLGLPIVRMPVPENPNPQPVTYEALQHVITTFVDDLQSADDALREVTSVRVELPLDIGRIRLDFDGSGAGTEDETLSQEVALLVGMRNAAAAGSLEFDFDGGDVLWLRAYSHLLMAIGNLALGYDWHQAFETTFQGVFPDGPFPLADTLTSDAAVQAQMTRLMAEMTEPPQLRDYQKGAKPGTEQWRQVFAEWQKGYEAWQKTVGGKKWAEYYALQNRLQFAGTVDLVTFVHLANWPVADASRLAAVVGDFEAMISLSRGSWRRILAETDSHREWIPSPTQTGGLPGMRVTEERVSGWMSVLDQFDAVIAGRQLLPHWRFDKGVNLRRFLLEPRPFDLVLLIQGTGAMPYLEDGPQVDMGALQGIMSVFGGDFMRYFVYFN